MVITGLSQSLLECSSAPVNCVLILPWVLLEKDPVTRLLVSVRAYGNATAGRSRFSPFHHPLLLCLFLWLRFCLRLLSSLAASSLHSQGFLEAVSWRCPLPLCLSVAMPVVPLHQVNFGDCPGVLLCSLYPKHRQMCPPQPSWELFLPCVSFTASLHLSSAPERGLTAMPALFLKVA